MSAPLTSCGSSPQLGSVSGSQGHTATQPVGGRDQRRQGPGRVIAARGADLQVVKERLGHGSLRATERYLHTRPDADETALDALAKVRNRRSAG